MRVNTLKIIVPYNSYETPSLIEVEVEVEVLVVIVVVVEVVVVVVPAFQKVF